MLEELLSDPVLFLSGLGHHRRIEPLSILLRIDQHIQLLVDLTESDRHPAITLLGKIDQVIGQQDIELLSPLQQFLQMLTFFIGMLLIFRHSIHVPGATSQMLGHLVLELSCLLIADSLD